MSEIVTLVDENDNEIGTKERSLLQDGDRWRIVTIWVVNDRRELLIAKRSTSKRIDPGKWGPSVAGTVTHGDSYLDTAKRELQEEIGVFLELQEIGLMMHRSHIGYRANMNYIARTNLKLHEFTMQKDEVDEIAWISIADLFAELDENSSKYVAAMDIAKEVLRDE